MISSTIYSHFLLLFTTKKRSKNNIHRYVFSKIVIGQSADSEYDIVNNIISLFVVI